MKLFLKKYAPIFGVSVLTILLVIGLRLIHNIDINLSEIALYINILTNTVLLRSIDDIVDYKADLEENKPILPKTFTLIMLCVCVSTTIVTAFIIQSILGTLLVVVYIGMVVLAFKLFNFLKTFIYPINIVISFVFLQKIYEGMFNQNVSIVYTLSILIIAIVSSIIITTIKGRK